MGLDVYMITILGISLRDIAVCKSTVLNAETNL